MDIGRIVRTLSHLTDVNHPCTTKASNNRSKIDSLKRDIRKRTRELKKSRDSRSIDRSFSSVNRSSNLEYSFSSKCSQYNEQRELKSELAGKVQHDPVQVSQHRQKPKDRHGSPRAVCEHRGTSGYDVHVGAEQAAEPACEGLQPRAFRKRYQRRKSAYGQSDLCFSSKLRRVRLSATSPMRSSHSSSGSWLSTSSSYQTSKACLTATLRQRSCAGRPSASTPLHSPA